VVLRHNDIVFFSNEGMEISQAEADHLGDRGNFMLAEKAV
jgi:hypothetical protein